MSRIINSNSPSKARNQNHRAVAEILRRLAMKQKIDTEAKDMAAALVYLLRAIHEGVDSSAKAWEKRGYWMKADRFLRQWQWTAEMAANLEDVIRNDAWELLPRLMGELMPHTSEIQVKRATYSADLWRGAHARLLREPPGETPW